MASENPYELASRIHAEWRREFGDYPHWDDADIFEMLEEGVDQEHIKAEWLNTVEVYNDSEAGADQVFSRLRKLDVDRPDINERTVADWLGKGLSELIITLEYLQSTSAPSPKDVTQRMYEESGQEPISDEDLWVEMHYNLLYATTHLPSAPVVLRVPHRSHHQYNKYFQRHLNIGLDVFLAKSQQIVPTTIVKLDRRMEKFIKEGAHPKALRTYIRPDRLDAYRKIRDKIGAHMIGPDVETCDKLWQFLKQLAADLHPHLPHVPWSQDREPTAMQSTDVVGGRTASQSQDPEPTAMQSTSVAAPKIAPSKKWNDVERHTLWRSINAWCHTNGVDKFTMDGLKGSLAAFADRIIADCANKGMESNRTAESVGSQIRDALRRGTSVANQPITVLGKEAMKMAERIKTGETIDDSERFPEEAIKIPNGDEPGAGLANPGADEDNGDL